MRPLPTLRRISSSLQQNLTARAFLEIHPLLTWLALLPGLTATNPRPKEPFLVFTTMLMPMMIPRLPAMWITAVTAVMPAVQLVLFRIMYATDFLPSVVIACRFADTENEHTHRQNSSWIAKRQHLSLSLH